MKVLFLDIDGVLNKRSDWEVIMPNMSNKLLNRVLLGRVHTIIKETNCKIVLSSTWRIFEKDIKYLEEYGQLDIFDKTPMLKGPRGLEIQAWLEEYPEVETYAIVDDDGDMLESQLGNFFQTEQLHGLTEGIAYRITYKLNNKDKPNEKHEGLPAR